MKKILSLFALILSAAPSFAQTHTYVGNTTTTTIYRGGLIVDSFQLLPVRDTSAWQYDTGLFRRVTIQPTNKRLYYHNGRYWKEIGTEITANSNGRSRVYVVDSMSRLTGVPQDTALAVFVRANRSLYYFSNTSSPASVSALGGGFWTPQNYFQNTNTGISPASASISFGTMQKHKDTIVDFQNSAAVNITQNYLATSNNPVYLSMSSPGTGQPNGFVFGTYGNGIGLQNRLYVRSCYSASASREVCYSEYLIAPEPATHTYPTVFKGFACFKASPNVGQLWSNTPVKDSTGVALAIETEGGGQFTDFVNQVKLFVRVFGDVHFNGNLYEKTISGASDININFRAVEWEYTGTGGNCILPDPTIPDNKDRVIKLINNGTGNLVFNYPVSLDGSNTISALSFTWPANVICVKANGAKWRVTQ